MSAKVRLFTIGHSIRPLSEFLQLLQEADIELLIDVRRQPYSRRHPHFGREALQRSCASAGIRYRHAEDLGGHREPLPDSPNLGLVDALRGYADHTRSPAFEREVERVLQDARTQRVALMCAEAKPDECHRRILSDYLTSHGHTVTHLLTAGQRAEHEPDAALTRDDHGHLSWRPRQRHLFD